VSDVPVFEPRSPFETAFRTAIEGADAYRAVRAGLRLHDDILRIGNRFVSVHRFREIAFIALGNAAGAMALAAQEMLGERLTQGLAAGAVSAPDTLQFQSITVPDPWPGSGPATSALASVLELASGLNAEDLLVLLLSPGAFSITAGPPVGWGPGPWRDLLQEVVSRSGPLNAARVARVLGSGAVGGRLGAAMREPLVATLVVDRGEGAEWVGGGPTVSLRPEEPELVRNLVSASAAGAIPRELGRGSGPNVHRPVVVTGPADAVEAAGNLLAGQGWISRMVSLHLPGPPGDVASQFVQGMETIRRDQVAEPSRPTTERYVRTDEEQRELDTGRMFMPMPSTASPVPFGRVESRGIAVFAGASFDTVEGGEGADELRAFLRAVSRQSVRREAYVGALRTAGNIADRGPGAGSWLGRRVGSDTSSEQSLETFTVRAGFTDVGTMLVGFVPWAAR
jgi:glycerate-2-kinase